MSKPAALRCAVYTRKSSEEGLEQEYNSLHAQRDACEAYIKSQVGEGWTCLKTAYDDGGISGGTMDRPGLKQLLADIAARRIDVVVVYKVDRLTRSLWDFAKIVEVFDKHQVSFVSVTQSFNTTSSMGRLTLNMLLSFAQFEREVTSERIRDKIAASKAKGMWMGGGVPLGYVADGRTLKIHEIEAETIRYIFRRYLELKSVHRLKAALDEEGVRSKLSVYGTGRTRGGCLMDRGALFRLLSNPVYLGKIRHKDKIYDGLHPAIIDQETFEAVGLSLEANRVKRTSGSARRTQSALVGKLFDEEGNAMTPTFANGRGGKRYRYYVSSFLQTSLRRADDDKIRRVSAPEVESIVTCMLNRLKPPEWTFRAQLRERGLDLRLTAPAGSSPGLIDQVYADRCGQLGLGERAWVGREGDIIVTTEQKVKLRGGPAVIDGATGRLAARPDRALIAGLRRAHKLSQYAGDAARTTYDIKLTRLAFLAPDIQQLILDGQQSRSVTLAALIHAEIPLGWSDQRIFFHDL